jgi:hypothetical protein
VNLRNNIRGTLPAVVVAALLIAPSGAPAQNSRFEEFTFTPPLVGEVAPDFTLLTVDGESFTLSEAYSVRPVVIEFGSYT